MVTGTQPGFISKKALWAGYILSTLSVLMLLMSGIMKFRKPPEVVEGFAHLGWDVDLALGLGIIEIACTITYLMPRTAVLGAILLTGYLGGATATHVRIREPFFIPVILGVLIWLGLYLRDERLRALIPLRGFPSDPSGGGKFSLLKKILGILIGIVVVLAFVIAVQPAEFRIQRFANFAATPADVFAQVNDFHNWENWSPWAKLDPAAKVDFEGPPAGTGAIFKWVGNDQIGEGSMTLTESRSPDLIRIQLDFVKPFPGTSNSEFTFKPDGDKTLVTWTMTGRSGFLEKAMCLVMNMDKMVGGQFEQGLVNLKGVVEGGRMK